jgi:hypothetical protein
MSPAATDLYVAVTYVDGEGVDGYAYAMVPTDAPGVVVHDDWGALGMRASGSNSISFECVELPESGVRGGFRAGDRCDLNRWLPLIKWLLAIPHYILLVFLYLAVIVLVIGAWFAILFTGRYPRGIFDFVEGPAGAAACRPARRAWRRRGARGVGPKWRGSPFTLRACVRRGVGQVGPPGCG